MVPAYTTLRYYIHGRKKAYSVDSQQSLIWSRSQE